MVGILEINIPTTNKTHNGHLSHAVYVRPLDVNKYDYLPKYILSTAFILAGGAKVFRAKPMLEQFNSFKRFAPSLI